jgi:flagellar biosynthesis anti-sigma factor FlgM
MSMKIDGQQQGAAAEGAGGARRTGRTETASTGGAAGASKSSGDRVELSSTAKLLDEATKVARDTPAIRKDVVERVARKLADGELGNDPGTLADSMLDDLLGK